VISLWESAQLDEFLFASGKRPGPQDHAVLRRYQQLTAGTHCRPHCGACLDRCPAGLPIHDVLHYRMYFEDYGAEKEAMRLYARLDTRANVCTGCSAPCASAYRDPGADSRSPRAPEPGVMARGALVLDRARQLQRLSYDSSLRRNPPPNRPVVIGRRKEDEQSRL
jgi:ferredoxin